MASAPSALPVSKARRPQRSHVRTILYFYLHLTGFLATTLLLTWGLFALFFLALGGFSLDGLMHQLDNLASRYVAASSERIAAFRHVFAVAHLILATGLIVLRRHCIMPARFPESTEHG
jgi:Zn-dependent protease